MTSACFSRGHTGFSRNATLVATVNPPALAGGVFKFAESDGQVSITDSFGTCSDLPELRVAPESVMIVFPNMNGPGTTSYRLQGEEVVEIK